MTTIGSIPVLVHEDGHVHILGRRRVTRRHLGRAVRRGLIVTVGQAHITAVPDTDHGRAALRCTVTHITGPDGGTIVDLRDAA
jgi:hypothetical protein